MPIVLPDRETLHDEFTDRYIVELPESDVSRGSDPYRLGRVVSGVVWSGIAGADNIIRQLLPDTAEGDVLVRWGKLLDIPRRGASISQGTLALRVSGTVGAAVPQFSELAHADGTLFETLTVGPPVIGGGGTVDVDVRSKTAGLIANKVTGETLSFTTPPANIQADAVLVADLSGGLDLETEAEWRGRIRDNLADPPEGGAVHDYVAWAKTVPGVKDVYVYRFRRGLGTLDLAVLQEGEGANRIIINTVPESDAIDLVRPATVKDVLMLTVAGFDQDVSVNLTIDETRFAWDWNDLGVGYPVTAINAGAKQITAAVPGGLSIVGKRLQVEGEEARVTARAGNVLTLDVWFSSSPLGKDVRASGDLVLPVQAAIKAEFKRLGPARGNYAVTSWNDQLLVYRLLCVAGDVDGVANVELVTPGGDVVLADTFSTQIRLLVPGLIQVWRKV